MTPWPITSSALAWAPGFLFTAGKQIAVETKLRLQPRRREYAVIYLDFNQKTKPLSTWPKKITKRWIQSEVLNHTVL